MISKRMEELESVNEAPSVLMLTPEGHEKLQKELDRLTVVKRAEIAERLRESKQRGEFSEDNSELDEVKFEQAMVESRIAELKTVFSGAQLLDPDRIPTDHVGVGSHVTVKDAERGIEFEVRIVSSFEADPDQDLISMESPMGLALVGKKVGEVAQFDAPAGKLRYQIVTIRR